MDPNRARELADSYLERALIAIRVRDEGVTLRHYLDPWWCFTRGLPFFKYKKQYVLHVFDNPCACGCEHAERLIALDFVSDGAREALERKKCKKIHREGKTDLRSDEDRLIAEHTVPIGFIKKHLLSASYDIDAMRDYLNRNYKRSLLTKAEDKRLNMKVDGRSLETDMPSGWLDGHDPFERYYSRGITGTPNPAISQTSPRAGPSSPPASP